MVAQLNRYKHRKLAKQLFKVTSSNVSINKLGVLISDKRVNQFSTG